MTRCVREGRFAEGEGGGSLELCWGLGLVGAGPVGQLAVLSFLTETWSLSPKCCQCNVLTRRGPQTTKHTENCHCSLQGPARLVRKFWGRHAENWLVTLALSWSPNRKQL